MESSVKRILQYIIGTIVIAIVSYCIASVLILGHIMVLVDFSNSSFFSKSYTTEEIIDQSENLEIVKNEDYSFQDISAYGQQFKTATNHFSRIHLEYQAKENNTGYLCLNIGVLSEENIDVRICIFDSSEEPIIVAQKVNEGINIFEIPLKNAKEIRIDFLTAMPTSLTIEQIVISNQLVGILPGSWYLCFFFCFLIGIEVLWSYLNKETKIQKILYKYLVEWIQLLKEDVKKVLRFVLKYKWAFLICFCICFFTYAYDLMNFSLGVDEERDIVRSIGTLENVKDLLVREGRYGLYIFRQLETVDGSFTVFVEEALAVIFIFLNIVIVTKCFDVVSEERLRESAIVIFGGMLASMPFINAEIMCYSIMNAGVYFSIMLTSTALLMIALFYKSKRKSKLGLALLLTVVALFFTEANNVWFITGTVLVNLVWVIANNNINWSDWIKYVLHYVGIYTVAFVIYLIIRSAIGQNGYTERYIQWGNGKFVDLLQGIWEWISTTLLNRNLPGAIYLLISIFIFVGFIIIYVLREKNTRVGLIFFLSICLLITPFSLCFVAGGKMPFRTMEALLLLEAGTWFVVINFVDKKAIARYILLLTAGIIIWKQCVWMNRIFFGADLNARLDMELGYDIGEEIERIVGSKQVDKPIVFVGQYKHTSPNIYKIDAVGQSIFYRESSRFKVYYLRYLGFNFQQADEQQVERAQQLSIKMNIWPLDGSIQEFEDIIVVHLN